MPLKLNIGLSRKVGESNYGSRGASVNVELELESALVAEPAKLQDRIRQLFALVRTSLAEELNGNGHTPSPVNGNGHSKPPTTNGNGHSQNGNGHNGNGRRQATQSQVKAIQAIARNQRLDLTWYLSEHHSVNRPEDLDLKTASQVIDDLKANTQEERR